MIIFPKKETKMSVKRKKIYFFFILDRQGLTLLLCIFVHNEKSGFT